MSIKQPSPVKRGIRLIRDLSISVYAKATPQRYVPKLLTIVVPAYNVERYIDDCLFSLRSQEHRLIEIVVVDDGSTDDTFALAKKQARLDPRIRIVRQANQGLSAARNTGVRHAHGEYLAFVDSDDTVQPEIYSKAITALSQSHSDFAVFSYRRLLGTRHEPPGSWIRRLHKIQQLGVTLDQLPEVQLNAVAWSKVYRRKFYDRAELNFPVGKLYEDQPVSTAAYASATKFDILSDIGVNWRIRDDSSSISQQQSELSNLQGQIDAGEQSLDTLAQHHLGHARAVRASQLLGINMNFYVPQLQNADDDYIRAFCQGALRLLDVVDAETFAQEVPVEMRVFYTLLRDYSIENALAFMRSGKQTASENPIVATDDGPLVDLALRHDDAYTLPDRLFLLGRADAVFYGGAHRVVVDGEFLVIEGWAYINGLDPSVYDYSLSAALHFGEQLIPAQTARRYAPEVDTITNNAYIDYRPTGFTARISLAALPTTPGEGWFDFNIVAGGFEIGSGLSRHGQPEPANELIIPLANGNSASIVATGPNVLTYVVDDGTAAAQRAKRRARTSGYVTDVQVNEEDDTVTFDAKLDMPVDISTLKGTLTSPVMSVDLTFEQVTDSEIRIVAPLIAPQWAYEHLPLPSARYQLDLRRTEDDSKLALWVGESMRTKAPNVDITTSHRVATRIRVGKGSPRLSIELSAPLDDSARSKRILRMRREAFCEPSDTPLDPHIFVFRSRYGEVADCNPLGTHRALRDANADMKLYWSVRDLSVPLPEGAIPLLENSQEWFDVTRRAKFYMVTVHEQEWYVKPQGQIVIQTFHGYPYKSMGHQQWDVVGVPPFQLANYDRRAREWDVVLSPAHYATDLLRDAFLTPAESEAELWEVGYPRNDILLQQGRSNARRAILRQHLDIREDQLAILYAPTYRDALQTSNMKTEIVEFFDLDELAAQLGDKYVILERGHPFSKHLSGGKHVSPNVRSVSSYPDINDLIAASDMAILDYSSLRFDYALTGKPMYFYIPDVESYHATRPGLTPYEPTAPGPHITDLTSLIEGLRAPDETLRAFAEERSAFRTAYAELDDGLAGLRLIQRLGIIDS